MKKVILSIVSLLLVGTLFAEVSGIFTLNTFFTPNNYPVAPIYYDDAESIYTWEAENPTTWNNLKTDWWMKRQDYWLLAFDKPGFFDFGFNASLKGFNLVLRMDIIQDILPNLLDQSSLKTNIPFVGSLLDLTFPRVSFLEYTSPNGGFYGSLGRRLIKWGPGSYDIQIDASQPYLDNIWLNYTTSFSNSSKWNFNYNYVLVSPKSWFQYDNPKDPDGDYYDLKTILGHKFNFYNEYVRLSIGELANIYNKFPTFYDLSPLVIWHNGNQDANVNVTLYVSAEGRVGPVRMFGTFNMDDFDLPHETHSDKPLAMGFSAGLEYHLFDGEAPVSEKFTAKDYILEEKTLKIDNGLNIGFEWYYTTPLMYNRNDTAGKFTIPFQFISLSGENYVFDYDAYFLGFKYGPNAGLFKLYAEYKDKPFQAYFSAELLTRGTYGIESIYGNRNTLDEMGIVNLVAIAGDKNTTLLLKTNCAFYLQDSLKLVAGLDFQQDFTHNRNAFALSLGISCNPFSTDWKNLF